MIDLKIFSSHSASERISITKIIANFKTFLSLFLTFTLLWIGCNLAVKRSNLVALPNESIGPEKNAFFTSSIMLSS